MVPLPESTSARFFDDSVNGSSASKVPNPRRRSERAHQAILNAAAELLEEVGYADMTIQAIAAKAGVSNKTIYRWWSNKAAVVMEAFAERTANVVAIPNTGSLRDDLLAFIQASFVAHKTMKFGSTMASLVAAIHTDSTLAEAFREQFIARRRAAVRQIFEQAIEHDELSALDLDVVIDQVYGPIFYRLLVGHAPLDNQFAETLVNNLLLGVTKSKNSSKF
ncbi:MAG: TetR/AcrR family transcriptional regulator [Hassallia sp. WJT32-NPBG1]|jgi:AcrR family transcriptional regulator|nr:TetR/AcrR family transcriptional regulator [Spirirestis rafaelensis WJT71-NPBG6]MBW4609070.1 TetR/AcrR family transcriptional regulator [Hassallia sp. WJT32-NPBG1]